MPLASKIACLCTPHNGAAMDTPHSGISCGGKVWLGEAYMFSIVRQAMRSICARESNGSCAMGA